MSNGGVYLSKVAIYDSIQTYGNGLVFEAYEVENVVIPSTSLTTIYSVNAPITGEYACWVYARVITSNTNTNLNLAWNDESGPETFNLTSGGFAVGAHPFAPVYIRAIGGTAIVLSVTVNHANQVFITSDLNAM